MISWCIDQIEKLVTPKKQEKSVAKTTGLIGGGTGAYANVTSQAIDALNQSQHLAGIAGLYNAQIANVAAQHNAQTANTVYTTTYTNAPQILGGSNQYWTTGSGGTWTATPVLTTIPIPTGIPVSQCISVAFVDYHGNIHYLEVDKNLDVALQQISNVHSARHNVGFMPYTPTVQKPCLPEPDFSLDDLGVAEKMIEEMNGTPGQ